MSMKATQQLDEAVLAYIKENPNSYSHQIRAALISGSDGITHRKISRSMTRLYNAGKITFNFEYKYTIKL